MNDAHALTGWDTPYLAPVRIERQRTDWLDSDKSVSDTVARMATHAMQSANSAQVKQALQSAGVQAAQDERTKLDRIFRYVKGHVRFVEDDVQLAGIFNQPRNSSETKELLIEPPALLSMSQPMGDCDDFSMLVASMCLASGIDCGFVTVAADADMPNDFTHVYNAAKLSDGSVMPIDASHGKYLGWETEKHFRKMFWPSLAGLKGLGMIKGLGQGYDYATDTYFDPGMSYASNYDVYANAGVNPGTVYTQSVPVSSPSSPSIDWNSILPGIFGAAEKVALQTTQQPGIQTTGPNGTSTSTVLPHGSTSFNIPGLSLPSGGMSPTLLIGGLVVVGLIAFMASKH